MSVTKLALYAAVVERGVGVVAVESAKAEEIRNALRRERK